MIQLTINDIKNDIIHLFQDERVWQAITEFSDDSLAGDRFVKSQFLVEEIPLISEKFDSKLFKELTEKYEKINFKASLLKFKESVSYVFKKTTLDDEDRLELFANDLEVIKKIVLDRLIKKAGPSYTLSIEGLENNEETKEKFQKTCLKVWNQKLDEMVLKSKSSNFYQFEQQVYTNRHFYLKD